MTFTAAELAYLRDQPIGRLATVGRHGDPQIRPVGVHLSPDEAGIDIVGHALASTQKWRNAVPQSAGWHSSSTRCSRSTRPTLAESKSAVRQRYCPVRAPPTAG